LSAKIEVVQNKIHEKSGETYRSFLEDKYKRVDHGWELDSNDNVVFWYSVTANAEDNPLTNHPKYVWEVIGESVQALNGRALELV